jgi:hypothetical protein
MVVWLIIFATIPFSLNSEELTNKELNDKIKDARNYFDEQNYDKAIQILTEVVESSPDRLDQAVALMDKITEIRNLYNKKYRELITALFEDEDPKRALELIEEMEALEKNPNKVAREAIRNARISAELVYNKIRLREIMDDAKIQLDLKKYNEALVIYQSGFNLGRQTYEESELVSEIEKGSVFRAIDEIYKSALDYLESGKSLMTDLNAFRGNITKSSSAGLSEDIASLIASFNRFSDLRDSYFTKSQLVDDSLAGIVAYDKNAPERFFLDFSKFILYGRNDVDYFEGIISTTDLFWEDQFRLLTEEVNGKMFRSYESAISTYDSGNFNQSVVFLTDTLNYAKYSISLYGLLNRRMDLGQDYSLDSYSEDQIRKYYGKLVDARILARATDSYNRMISLRETLSTYDLREDQPLDELYTLRISIVNDLPLIDEEEVMWAAIEGSINWLNGYEAVPDQSQDIQTLVRNDLSALKSEMKDINLAILTKLTDQEYKRITGALIAFEDDYSLNQTTIEGIVDEEVVAYTGDDQLKSSFPDRALPEIESLIGGLDLLSNDALDIIDTFMSGDIEITEESGINEFLAKLELVIPQIQSLSDSSEDLEILARDNIFRAEGFENQGNKFLENVEEIVSNPRAGRESYDRARENLKDANNAFYQSFSYKENLELRQQVDEAIASLQQQLLDGENRLVVADVRNLINQGKEAYVNRQYSRSRVYLEQAQNRWLTTNADEHPEILYWMALVDLALQFDRGRSLSKTEPLYDEMTQYLNLAYSNFNRGVNLYSRGDKVAGRKALDSALSNLENVTIFMPKNESASLLRLKIAQLIDPEEFRESFSIRIDEAWEKLQSNNKTTQGEGYVELVDLSKIDSNYPGLQNKITIAEYDILKTRRRPPNPKDLAESVTLYEQALAIVEGGVRTQFEIALTWLDQSIALNPNNSLAISLKDRIQLDTGGTGTVVLPLALENRFREAQQLYEQENYLNAYTIILELKKDVRSAKYPPLLKLEERVKLKLQI